MVIQYPDGSVDRVLVGLADCEPYQALVDWALAGRAAGWLHEFVADYHRLQVEHWIWSRLQPTPTEARVLDIGVYLRRDWIGPGYRTLGPVDTAADIVGDVLEAPAAAQAGAWDVIVCTEVLEHCQDPSAALAALRTWLRPGGRLLASSPFLWADHRSDDYPDYWRFTEQGWSLLLDRAGFRAPVIQGCLWSKSGAAAYYLLRQTEAFGYAALTRATTGYLVEATA